MTTKKILKSNVELLKFPSRTLLHPRWVKPILRSDEEKELRVTSARGQRKLVVKNFSQTFVKNAFYFLRILVL